MTTKKSVRKPAKKTVSKVENKRSAVSVTHTDAASEKPVFHASHAESVQAAENENKEFAAAIFVPVEAMPEAMRPTVLQVARAAWASVKDVGDPDFDACVPTHRDKFISHAEAILRGASPQEGDTLLARFERAVSKGE